MTGLNSAYRARGGRHGRRAPRQSAVDVTDPAILVLVNNTIQAMTALADTMDAETEAMRDMDMDGMKRLAAAKAELFTAYQGRVEAMGDTRGVLTQLAEDDARALRQARDRLMRATELNMRTSQAAQSVTNRVVKAIARAAKGTQDQITTYSKSGKAYQRVNPAKSALTLDQSL